MLDAVKNPSAAFQAWFNLEGRCEDGIEIILTI